MANPSIYFAGAFSLRQPQACVYDVTPPTFSGIQSLVARGNGSLRAAWSAGTDATLPIRYRVYIQSTSATGLFSSTNIVYEGPLLQFDIFALNDGTLLLLNNIYYVGVRAIDAVGNVDSNTVSLNATSSGVFDDTLANFLSQMQLVHTNLVADHVNFQGDHTAFQADHTNFSSDHTNFQSDHTALSGDHTNFQTDHTNFQSDHTNFQTDHTNFQTDIAVLQAISHKMHGVFSINSSNQLIGTLWASYDGTVTLVGLGAASYAIYDATGTAVAGLSQSGITADVNGRYIITPVASVLQDLTHYTVKITINIDGIDRTSYRGITLGI